MIDQFQVHRNPRYLKDRQGRGETYCNIFVWDVTRAMRAEIPHRVDQVGEPAGPGLGQELTANGAIEWLRRHGPRFGWHEVNVEAAGQAACGGSPAVVAWRNRDGPGHMAMIRPSPATAGDLLVAQAGERNAGQVLISEAFATAWRRGELGFFIHD